MGRWTGKHGRSVRCSKAIEQAGSGPYCSIQRVSSSSPPFLDAYMLGLLPSLCLRRIWPSRSGLLPRLRTIANDAQPMLVLTTSSILSKVEGLFAQAPELRTLRWLATDKVVGSAARRMAGPGSDRQHPGFAPIHFGLHRCTERRNGQSREPPPELGPHQPGIRDYVGHCLRDMATGLP